MTDAMNELGLAPPLGGVRRPQSIPAPRPVRREPMSAPTAFVLGATTGAASTIIAVCLTAIYRGML